MCNELLSQQYLPSLNLLKRLSDAEKAKDDAPTNHVMNVTYTIAVMV